MVSLQAYIYLGVLKGHFVGCKHVFGITGLKSVILSNVIFGTVSRLRMLVCFDPATMHLQVYGTMPSNDRNPCTVRT